MLEGRRLDPRRARARPVDLAVDAKILDDESQEQEESLPGDLPGAQPREIGPKGPPPCPDRPALCHGDRREVTDALGELDIGACEAGYEEEIVDRREGL